MHLPSCYPRHERPPTGIINKPPFRNQVESEWSFIITPMSPRPRQNTDAEILAAAFRAIARLGPARLTLADVAEEAGVTAAALVQRFGLKRALLLACAADVSGGHVYIFTGLRQKHRSPVAALLGLAECMSLMGSTPDEVAHSLAFLQLDFGDAEFLAFAAGGRARHARGDSRARARRDRGR